VLLAVSWQQQAGFKTTTMLSQPHHVQLLQQVLRLLASQQALAVSS
jgi:hypothetical protein